MRLALRRLRRRPARSLAVVVVLGLGVGAAVAAFSAVRAVLLRPLPLDEPGRVVVAWHENPARPGARIPFTPEALERVASAVDALVRVGGFQTVGATPSLLDLGDDAVSVARVGVAGDFFGALGARPAQGRLLEPSDDEVGAEPVVVVSEAFWRGALGGDPGALGRSLTLDGRGYRLVGVADAGLDLPRGAEAWTTVRGASPDWEGERPIVELDLVGRLAAGVEPAEAARRVQAALAEDAGLAGAYGGLSGVAVPLLDHLVGPFRAALRGAMGASLLLLLVAAANAALLLMTGGVTPREVATRRAIGGGGLRSVAPLLADAALLAAGGVLAGLLLAWGVVEVLLPLAPSELPRLSGTRLDPVVVGFALAAGAVAALTAGAAAALGVSRGTLREALSETGGGGGKAGAARRALPVAQVALAVVAAVGGGLLARTVANLESVELGFEPEGLFAVSIDHDEAPFRVGPGFAEALAAATSVLSGAPGVSGGAPTLNLPLAFNGGVEMVPTLEGQAPEEVRRNPYVSFDAVLPGHFEVLGAALIEGRPIGGADVAGATPAVVVNEAMARALWPGRSALGERLEIYPGRAGTLATVVGVAADDRYRSFPEARPAAWVSLAQYAEIPPGRFLVRATGAEAAGAAVASALAAHVPSARVEAVESLATVMQGPLRLPRFAARVLGTLAALTLLLAGLGVYGTFALLVEEGRREVGIRRALGARDAHLARHVLGRVLAVAALGAGVGGVASWWASVWIESLLYGVAPTDPLTVAGVVAGVLALAVAAAGAPVARAVRIDPVAVLRAP